MIRGHKGAGPMLALAALREHGRLRDSAVAVRSVLECQNLSHPPCPKLDHACTDCFTTSALQELHTGIS